MAPKRLLIIVLGSLERDFRVQKQITTLKRNYRLTVASFSPSPIDGPDYVALRRSPLSGSVSWLAAKFPGGAPQITYKLASFLPSLASLSRHDLVLCNDANSLPLGVWLKRRWKCPLVLDAHEYAPAMRKSERKRERMVALCRECLPEVAGATTVSKGLVGLYRENFGLACELLPNVPYLKQGEVTGRTVTEPFQLICHGVGARGRGLMELIDLAGRVGPRWHLNLMLVPPGSKGGREHHEKVIAAGRVAGNVSMKDPVDAGRVVSEISRYDAGVYLMPGDSSNKVHALPNKIFDFLQAGLAIFVGPDLEEMSAFVREHGCGAVSGEHRPDSMAALLRSVSADDLARMKERSRALAAQWCYERFEPVLLDVVESALEKAGS